MRFFLRLGAKFRLLDWTFIKSTIYPKTFKGLPLGKWLTGHSHIAGTPRRVKRGTGESGGKPGPFTSQTFGVLAPVLVLWWCLFTGACFLNVRPVVFLDIHCLPHCPDLPGCLETCSCDCCDPRCFFFFPKVQVPTWFYSLNRPWYFYPSILLVFLIRTLF